MEEGKNGGARSAGDECGKAGEWIGLEVWLEILNVEASRKFLELNGR